MFPHPIKSKDMFDEFVKRDYAILFFVNKDHTRLLEFRNACNDAVWHCIQQRLVNYTCVRQGWTGYLKAVYPPLKPDEGVAFFKKGRLLQQMPGFALPVFIETLKAFDPHGPMPEEKKAAEASLCDCCMIL
ncbi:hypothetical protein GGI25_001985 [Coemansia spiralis]|uniref:Uncharacterized protein n=2 Tax=Coemansia TaxID=4863 RepID=A0A9W8GBE9_9FUNG|nr:hypothetical protein EDC05_006237 [Coemansia umbellata]KAJ2623241.1 hypothetical protein GGI26_002468 [Coemansia sp. RSA 1358]KAJ2678793.1 hypothetical protein GGI25_001985 [Coemansia spiralis]